MLDFHRQDPGSGRKPVFRPTWRGFALWPTVGVGIQFPGLGTPGNAEEKERRCGQAFGDADMLEIDRYRVERIEKEQKNAAWNWKPQKFYTFTLLPT